MIDEEKRRLTERMVWPILALMTLSSMFAAIEFWGIREGRIIALPALALLAGLIAISVRWFLRWRREAAAYVSPPQPLYMERRADISLREYREPVSRSMLWYVPQAIIVMFCVWVTMNSNQPNLGGGILVGLFCAACFTACASGAGDGLRWLRRKWQEQRLKRL